jgi:hypothetical protein
MTSQEKIDQNDAIAREQLKKREDGAKKKPTKKPTKKPKKKAKPTASKMTLGLQVPHSVANFNGGRTILDRLLQEINTLGRIAGDAAGGRLEPVECMDLATQFSKIYREVGLLCEAIIWNEGAKELEYRRNDTDYMKQAFARHLGEVLVNKKKK